MTRIVVGMIVVESGLAGGAVLGTVHNGSGSWQVQRADLDDLIEALVQFRREQREQRERSAGDALAGVDPIDESRVVAGCTRQPLCSPYMPQHWAHDSHCPVGHPWRAR